MATRMQQRRGTAAQWTSANPILAAGEIGFETDTGKFKMGNGSSAWSALSYFADSSDFDTAAIESTIDSKVATAVNNLVAGAPAALNTLNELALAIDSDSSFASTVTTALSQKAGLTAFSNHANATTSVHGIANTSLLETIQGAQDKADAAQAAAEAAAIAHANSLAANYDPAGSGAAAEAYADSLAVNYDPTGSAAAAQAAAQAYADGLSVNYDAAGAAAAAQVYADGLSVNYDPAGAAATAQAAAEATAASDATNKANAAQTAAEATAASALSTHNSDTTDVHGIANTANLVLTNDARLSDTRTPTDNTVSTAKVVDSAVTTEKIADSNVTAAKLATDSVETAKVKDSAITTAKIAANAVTDAKIQSGGLAQSSVSGLVSDLAAKAPLASPALTGTPTAPTATAGTNTTQIATTAFVSGAVADLVASAPAALNTLNELATALGNDASFSTTVTNSLAAKAPLASPTFTGTVTVSASGVAFTDGTQTKEGVPSRTPIIQKTAAYTLSALSERDSMIEVSHSGGSAVDITIPANSAVAYPVGTSIDVLRTGTGGVRIVGAAGVTVNATPGAFLRAQWSAATLFKRATDTWVLIGDLATA